MLSVDKDAVRGMRNPVGAVIERVPSSLLRRWGSLVLLIGMPPSSALSQDAPHVSSGAPRFPDCEVRLGEDLRLGSLQEPPEQVFGALTSLAVSESGTVFLLDGLDGLVRTFDSSGRHVRAFGGLGNGPGEFSGPNRIAYGGSSLFVFDRQQQALLRFDTGGSYVQKQPLPAPTIALPFLSADERSVYLAGLLLDARPDDPVVIRFDHGFAAQPGGGSVEVEADSADTYFVASGPIAPDGLGGFWFSPFLEYRLQHYDESGRLTRVVTRPHAYRFREAPLRKRSEDGPLRRLGLDVNRALIVDLHADEEGRVWVVIADKDAAGTTIDAFERDGTWLLSSTIVGQERPQRLAGGRRAYATTTRRGYPELIRYGVQLRPSGDDGAGSCPS